MPTVVQDVTGDSALQTAIAALKAKIEGAEESGDIDQMVSELKNTIIKQLEPNYKVLLQKGESANTSGELIPFITKTGDSITASSHDGTAFGNVQLRFYDENKTFITNYVLSSGYGKSRTFTVSLSKTSFYIGITTVDVTSPSLYDVLNNTNEYYIDIDIDGSINAKNTLLNAPFIGRSFVIEAGKEHSSTKDKIEVNLKAGEEYRVIKTDGILYAYYSDGTSQSVDINGIAQKDIISFGLYKNNSTASPMEIRFFVIQDPVGVDIYDLNGKIDNKIDNKIDSNIESTKKLLVNGYYAQQTETGHAIMNNKAIGAVVDLTPVASEGNASIIVSGISEGMKFLIFGSGTYNYLFWSFLDKERKLISKANSWASSGATGVKITAPAGSYYLVCSGVANYAYGFNVQFLSASDYIAEQIGSSGDNSGTIMANFKKNADFTFSFFSDVHGGSINVQHIIDHAVDNSVDTIINGGDTILRYIDDPNESFAWYEEVLSQSSVDILSAVGNHDVWKGGYWVKAPATEVYNAIIKPVVTNFSGIIQPTSAEANGLCYYYKDYGNVRVIIINAMAGSDSVSFWDSAQATWFTNVLSDAKTNNKHVIVCTHGPYPKSIAQRDEKSNWNSWIDYRAWASSDNIVIETEPLNMIKEFIEGGGKFVCLLTGHEHCDSILFATGYENILMVNVASAKYSNHSDGLYYSDPESQYYDCFNYCAVDTTNGIMKMIRVGWGMDAALKRRETFAYNYITSKIIKE